MLVELIPNSFVLCWGDLSWAGATNLLDGANYARLRLEPGDEHLANKLRIARQ